MKPVLLLLIILHSVIAQYTRYIRDGTHLVDTLCGEWIDEDVTITLNHSSIYHIPSINITCVVRVSTSLTIASDTANTANVTCTNNYYKPVSTVGFLFIAMNVTVSNIVFTGCAGATLLGFNETFDSHINSTAPFFTSCHSALFTCVQSFITITEVTIDDYYGFAIATIDTLGALFSHMTITNGNIDVSIINRCYPPGCGVLISFTYKLSLHSNVTVQNSNFLDNCAAGSTISRMLFSILESSPSHICCITHIYCVQYYTFSSTSYRWHKVSDGLYGSGPVGY